MTQVPDSSRVLSGIQPTGNLHLGNYLGAIRRWVEEQDRVDGFFCIVDLHAITIPHEPAELRLRTLEVAALLFAAGLDPERSTVFVQSHVPEHTELAWVMSCLASFGELNRMTQWKEKSEGRESVGAGLLTYPALQAADILLYQASEVPVGEDQRQHLELTRNLAQRFNHRFGEVFRVPEATYPKAGARVMDLQRVGDKMSKSLDSPKGTLYLLDSPDDLRAKVMSAVTDSGSEIRVGPEKEGVTNLLGLLSAITDEEVSVLEERFAGRGYADLKREAADAVIELLRPLRARHEELVADPDGVRHHLARATKRAGAIAEETMTAVREALGLLPPEGTTWTTRGAG